MIDEQNQNLEEEIKEEVEEESTIFGAPTTITLKQKKTHSKKLWLLILIIGLIAIVCGVGVYGVSHWIPETSDASTASTVEELAPIIDEYKDGDVSVITSVDVQNDSGSYTICKNDEGFMTVKAYADLPHASSSVEEFLSNFLKIVPKKVIKENATKEELASCGLTESKFITTVHYTDGKSVSLVIGDLEKGESEGYYLCEQGKSTIYLVEPALFQAMDTHDTSLLSTTLMSAPNNATDDSTGTPKVIQLDLSGSIRPKRISMRYINDEDSTSVKMAGNMVMTAPYYRGTDTTVLQEWDTNLVALNADSVVCVHPTAEQLSSYGLNDRSVADFTVAVRKSTDEDGNNLDEVKVYNKVSYTIRLGNKDTSGAYYAMVDGVDIVYLVNATYVPWAECQYEDLVNDTLFLRNIVDISKFEIGIDGKTSVVNLKHGKVENSDATSTVSTLEASCNGKALDEESTRAIYRLMMMIQRLAPAPEDASDAGTPALRIALSAVNENSSEVTDCSFYPYSANRYLCVCADGDSYLVKASDIETFITQSQKYLAGEKVSS